MGRSSGSSLAAARFGGALVGVLVCWGLLVPAAAAWAADQCVACHTDPATLKALVQPPTEIVEEEGEG